MVAISKLLIIGSSNLLVWRGNCLGLTESVVAGAAQGREGWRMTLAPVNTVLYASEWMKPEVRLAKSEAMVSLPNIMVAVVD